MMVRKDVLTELLLLLPERGVRPHFQAAFGVIMGIDSQLSNAKVTLFYTGSMLSLCHYGVK